MAAEKTVSLADILQDVCKMEELKKSSPVTKAVLKNAQDMLAMLDGEILAKQSEIAVQPCLKSLLCRCRL